MDRKTYLAKKPDIKRKWHHIDAAGKVLGRLATDAANKLRGKGKVLFTPYVDCGDFVVVTNAEKVVLTGKKLEQKLAFRHSLWQGGAKFTPYSRLMLESPEKAIKFAVEGMLPANKLASRQMTRLKVYKGPAHPHAAQFAKAVESQKTQGK